MSKMSSVTRHSKFVHEYRYQYVCNLCGKGVRDGVELRGHMANRHGMPKDFKCDICDREFAYKRQLVKHKVVHGT